MGDLGADITTFVGIMASNWVSWVGGAFTVMQIAEGALGAQNIPRWVRKIPFRWLAIGCLSVAAFQAWQAEHQVATNVRLDVRRLTDSERAALLSSLPTPPAGFTIKVHSTGNQDPESFRYALDFVEVFRAGGWTVVEDHSAFAIRLPGLSLATHDAADSTALKILNAIDGAGIPLSESTHVDAIPSNQVDVYVGRKLTAPFVE